MRKLEGESPCSEVLGVWLRSHSSHVCLGNITDSDIQKAGLNPFFPDSKVHGANMGPIWGRQDIQLM